MADARRPVRKHPKGLWNHRSFLGRSSGRGVEEESRRTAISFMIWASGHRRIRSTSQLKWNLFLRTDGGEWIGLCQRPDALAVRQIFGSGRDSGQFALPVDVWGLACRKLSLTIQKSQDGGSSALSLAHAAFPLPREKRVHSVGNRNALAYRPGILVLVEPTTVSGF
jgi:hypothetical protein